MAQDFTITKVSSNPPTPWKNGISYYKVMLEGVPTPQEIGKKSVPQEGQTVYGEIIDGKFKRMDKPQDGFSGGSTLSVPFVAKPAYQPKDEAAIKAMFAIKAAIPWVVANKGDLFDVFEAAKSFYSMVDDVKAGSQGATSSSATQGNETPSAPAPDLPPVENYDSVPTDLEDEVNLDDIPF